MKVRVYSTPNCHKCRQTKRLFDEAGVTYQDLDLTTLPEKLEEFRKMGHQTAPVVEAGDRIWSDFRLPEIRTTISEIFSEKHE